MRSFSRVVALACALLPLTPAWGAPGTLALVNAGDSGEALAARAQQALGGWIGGLARREGVADFLLGRPGTTALPAGDEGQSISRIVGRVRARQQSQAELVELGRILGVDYLVLLRVKPSSYAAQLFSIRRQQLAPQGLESKGHDLALLKTYILSQTTGTPESQETKRSPSRWWVWALALGLGGLTLGLALTSGDESAGDLTIRARR